jgi:hypothetical protein
MTEEGGTELPVDGVGTMTVPAYLRKLADEIDSGRRISAGAVITTNANDEMLVYSFGVEPGMGRRLLIDFVVSFHETHGLGKKRAPKEVPSILVPGSRLRQ